MNQRPQWPTNCRSSTLLQSVEAPPGVREAPFGGLYLAYLRDPDGNKLSALYRMGT
jgi:hypothetical protein